jgi:hypothetical protein
VTLVDSSRHDSTIFARTCGRWNCSGNEKACKGHQWESLPCQIVIPRGPKLRDLVRDCVKKHLDQRPLARTRRIEPAERETLVAIQQQMRRWWRLAT